MRRLALLQAGVLVVGAGVGARAWARARPAAPVPAIPTSAPAITPTLVATYGNAAWQITDSATVVDLERRLHQAGAYDGPLDGSVTAALIASIGRFQAQQGLPITDMLDDTTARRLGLDNHRAAELRFGAPVPGGAPLQP